MGLIKKYKDLKKKYKKNKIKKILKEIVTSNSSPHQIALGAALGVFLSVIPTFLIGMFVALFLAWRFNLNLLSTYLGTLIVNPYTGSFIYLLDYQIGAWLIGGSSLQLPITIQTIGSIARQAYLGGLILSAVVSTLTYLIVYLIAYTWKK